MKALALLALVPALASAEVIYHSFPRGHGVTKALRKAIARAVRDHVRAAGHRLGPKRHAKHVLATRIARDGDVFVVVVRYRPRRARKAEQFTGTALREAVVSVLSQFLEQILPTRKREEAPPPRVEAGPKLEGLPEPKIVSTWMEDQPRWPNVYEPGEKVVPFPPATDPPPKVGKVPSP
jgi:hypothetical protein